jgi:hypothetical protein
MEGRVEHFSQVFEIAANRRATATRDFFDPLSWRPVGRYQQRLEQQRYEMELVRGMTPRLPPPLPPRRRGGFWYQ